MTEIRSFRIEVLIVGDVCVGKTLLLSRFLNIPIKQTEYFHHETTATIDGMSFRVILKSEPKEEPGMTYAPGFNVRRGCTGFICVYDITNSDSFRSLPLWIEELNDYEPSAIIMMVGNKCDLHYERQITTEEAREFAEENSYLFFETSARDSTNVQAAFMELFTGIYCQHRGVTLYDLRKNYLKNLEKSVRVETTILTINGAPGSGKSSVTDLVLGNPPAKERHSTLIATSPARSMAGCRVAATEHVIWKRVRTQEMMELLADSMVYLNEHPQKANQHPTSKIDNASTSSVTFSLFDHIKSIFGYKSNVKPQSVVQSSEQTPQTERNQSTTAKCLLSLLSSAKESDRLFSAHWIYLIDSGGQPQFQEVLPLFVHHNSVNIITHRLCEELSEKPVFEFVVHGKHTSLPSELRLTNLDMIVSLFRSQSSVRGQSLEQAKKVPSKPHFVLVGTFLDQADTCPESVEEKNHVLREVLSPYKNVRIDSDPSNGEIIFAVNAITTEGREELASRLRQHIMGRPEARLVVNVPMRWFLLELELSRIAEEKCRYVLTLEECTEAGELLSVKPSELKEALNYFNSLSMYLYVPECLPDTVFVTFQPVLNKLSTIIAVTFGNAASLLGVLKLKPGALQQLRDEGIFTIELLHCLPDGFIPTIFTAEHFVKLLSHLLVAAPVRLDDGVTGYFLPCVLQQSRLKESEKKLFVKNTNSWILTWDLESTPVGLFIAFIVSLLNRNKEPRFTLSRSHRQLRNAIRLSCIDFGGALLIIDHTYWLEVYYSGSASLCPDIRQTVLGSIAHATQRLNYSANMQVGFPCRLCRNPIEHPCIVHCPHNSQHPLQCIVRKKCKVCADPISHYQLSCSRDKTTTGTVTSAHLPWLPHTPRPGEAVSSPSSHDQHMHDSTRPVSSSQQTMQDSIKQLLTESSVDLHIAMSTDPSSIAVLLYSSSFIGDSTLNYVRTAMGVSNHDKAFRVLDDCRSNILSHPKPKNRLREFIVILKDSQPTTKLVAARIEEKLATFQ